MRPSIAISPTHGNSRSALKAFASTQDGRWGVLGTTLINLETGKSRDDAHDTRVIGNYMGDVAGNNNKQGLDLVKLLDPNDGRVLGKLRDVGFSNSTALATTGVFSSPGTAQSPGVGTTSDGERVIAYFGGPSNSRAKVVAFSLANGMRLWSRSEVKRLWLLADGGGVAVISDMNKVIGLDDKTGETKWSLPYGEVCGITDSQMLLAINNQLAQIDLDTGKQIAYSDEGADCPDVRPGGISVSSRLETSGNTTTVTQSLKP